MPPESSQDKPRQAEPNQTQPNRTKAKQSEARHVICARQKEGSLVEWERSGHVGRHCQNMKETKSSSMEMLTSCHVQGASPLPPYPPALLCPALDWTHVGQSGLPLAVKLFNWSLIGCDCSALGGTARCRACFLTLQAKVMIPTTAPAPASAPALPLFAGRSHFIFCFAPSAK